MFAGVAVVPVCSPPKLCRASCFMFLIKHQEFISAAVRLLVFSLARFTVVGSVLLNMKLVDSHRYYCVFMSCSGSGSSRSRWVQSCNVWPALCHHSVGSKCRWTWWTSLTAPDLCWSFSTFGAHTHFLTHGSHLVSVPCKLFYANRPGPESQNFTLCISGYSNVLFFKASLKSEMFSHIECNETFWWGMKQACVSVLKLFSMKWHMWTRTDPLWTRDLQLTPAQIITENIILMWFSKTG